MADTFFDQEENTQSQGASLDFKRVLARAIRFWYVILISLVAALAFAFYNNNNLLNILPALA